MAPFEHHDLSAPLLQDDDAISAPVEEGRPASASAEASPLSEACPSDPPAVATALVPEVSAPYDDDDDDDRAAMEEAASAAREQCTDLIRNHLRSHMSQNPDSAYVTWVATLHPENATVTLDPRFHIPGNPWLTVYEEAQRDCRIGGNSEVDDKGGTEEEEGGEGASVPAGIGNNGAENGPPVTGSSVRTENNDPKSARNRTDCNDAPRKTYSGCVDLAVGYLLALVGMALALGIELFALPIYACEVLCHRISKLCSPPNLCTILPFLPFWALLQLFWIADALLLVMSVLMVELIAIAGMVLCTPLALSFLVGLAVHQRIRKLAHLTRWACRQCFVGRSPARATFGCNRAGERSRQNDAGADA